MYELCIQEAAKKYCRNEFGPTFLLVANFEVLSQWTKAKKRPSVAGKDKDPASGQNCK